MLHIVLEHDPAVEDQRVIDEGFLTAQADRVGDPHLDVFACFLRNERRQIQGGEHKNPGEISSLGKLTRARRIRRCAMGWRKTGVSRRTNRYPSLHSPVSHTTR